MITTIFIGYSLERKGWLFYSLEYKPTVFWSNSVKFLETECWTDHIQWCPVDIQPPPTLTNEEDSADLGYTEENLFDEKDPDALCKYNNMEQAPGPDEHPDTETWINNGAYGLTVANIKREMNLDPTVWEALAGEDRSLWKEAMRKELDGLEAMGTWEVMDLPPGVHTVNTCWVLKIKTDSNLIPTKFKARLVAQGFTQKEGVNYTKIFALVAPIQSIRGVLSFAAVQDWEVDSIDVKQAYLNSNLHHDIYLKPPIGMQIPPGKVFKLMKGLYGLKQSGWEWNVKLDSHLWKIGFHCMPSAPCLYMRGTGDKLTVITAYVDGMIIASPSRREVDRTKHEIMHKWGTKDNGQVKEFLSIKII